MSGCWAAGITRVGQITGLDVIGLPVWFATRPNSRNLAVAQGKAQTDAGAQIAAIMESIEGASAERSEILADLAGSISQLERQGAPLLPFEDVFSCEPSELSRRRERQWRRGTSLFTGEEVLAPLELVGLDLRSGSGLDHRSMRIHSVGLGAHFSRDAALLHGLLEVIENDANAVLETYPAAIMRFPPIDAASATRPDLVHWLSRLRAEGIAVHLRDISTDIALPVVTAAISMPEGGGHYATGSACRFDPEAAALAALMEAIQSRLTYISGARDDMYEENYAGRHELMTVSSRGVKSKRFAGMHAPPIAADAGVAEQIAHVMAALRQAGVSDVFAFDFPPLVEGVSVVRTIVTDLQIAFEDGPTRIGPRILDKIVA